MLAAAIFLGMFAFNGLDGLVYAGRGLVTGTQRKAQACWWLFRLVPLTS
jgi:hypothetical protein